MPPSSPPIDTPDGFDASEDNAFVDEDEQEEDARARGRRVDAPDDEDDEDDVGEDLFGDTLDACVPSQSAYPGMTILMIDPLSDYASNDEQDRYDTRDLDDRSSQPELTRAQRLAAERAMDRRDRGLPGARAARRDRAPAFLQSDDDEEVGYGGGLLDGIETRRRRRQYDERMDEDDVEDEEVWGWHPRSTHCLLTRDSNRRKSPLST